ncbi:ABC transporter permease subunit [Glaciecola sp. MH2013]|uniref:ABC transporter permease subunit n=1 Tax=Glaciecola sp. MH2013 TaxID=2785524 RepID=UPI00189DC77F|nr:ABC transporter permease subunit [Glaciecola sp. MH2013]MBF7072017.1 ABC transporter permease subunit [Glaciecola sp. MH2013]
MNNQQREFNQDRFRKDWLARRIVTAAGWLVLATFILIIWHIFSHAFPLFKSPSAKLIDSQTSIANASLNKVVELSNGNHVLATDGCDLLLIKHAQDGALRDKKRFPFPCGYKFVFPEQNTSQYIGIVTNNALFELHKLSTEGEDYHLTLESSISVKELQQANAIDQDANAEITELTLSIAGDFIMLSASNSVQELHVYSFNKLRPADYRYRRLDNVSTHALLPRSQHMITVEENMWSVRKHTAEVVQRQILATPINTIFIAPSQRSLFTLDTQNVFTKWVMVNKEGRFEFVADTNNQTSLEAMATSMVFDLNSNAALLVFDAQQYAFVNKSTNEVFERVNTNARLHNLVWQGRYIYSLSEQLTTFELADMQGITTLKSLVSKVWYEGYDEAKYVWQTSSAAPGYESKKSIMPLIIGSLKASLLALVVAIPLALGAAIYTAFFADLAVRNIIKPAIEMLEAVPSVIIGFIAAVWLVPIAESFLLSLILFIILLPFVLLFSAIMQPKVAELLNDRLEHKWELLFIMLGVTLLGLFCFSLSDLWQLLIFGGSDNLAAPVQLLSISKTTIVVAIALGVAISPSIYSLAEDALFEVPEGIKQASYALGATKLQTLRKVILAVALPSILSAVMLGFGRAFGETMIVLMVTGNTAISDWSILEGLRAMTANLAIELSEASSNSAHFNTLFLTAGILFIFTFIVNTAAEILRKRLRLLYHYG